MNVKCFISTAFRTSDLLILRIHLPFLQYVLFNHFSLFIFSFEFEFIKQTRLNADYNRTHVTPNCRIKPSYSRCAKKCSSYFKVKFYKVTTSIRRKHIQNKNWTIGNTKQILILIYFYLIIQRIFYCDLKMLLFAFRL